MREAYRRFVEATGDIALGAYQLHTALKSGDLRSAVVRTDAGLRLYHHFEPLEPEHCDQLVFDTGDTLTTMHANDSRVYLVSRKDLEWLLSPSERDKESSPDQLSLPIPGPEAQEEEVSADQEAKLLAKPERAPCLRWKMIVYVLLRDFGEITDDDYPAKLHHFTNALWQRERKCPLGKERKHPAQAEAPNRDALIRAVRDYLRRPKAYVDPRS